MGYLKSCGVALPVLVITAIAVGAYLLYGGYDVAASHPHSQLTKWAFATAMENSVKRRSDPGDPGERPDPALVPLGAREFREMCIACHGAPGIDPGPVGKGLNPRAPELSEAAKEWSLPELRWIIDNGIKMSGMPAFTETHGEREISALAAFVKSMEGRSADGYRTWLDSLGLPAEPRPAGVPE